MKLPAAVDDREIGRNAGATVGVPARHIAALPGLARDTPQAVNTWKVGIILLLALLSDESRGTDAEVLLNAHTIPTARTLLVPLAETALDREIRNRGLIHSVDELLSRLALRGRLLHGWGLVWVGGTRVQIVARAPVYFHVAAVSGVLVSRWIQEESTALPLTLGTLVDSWLPKY